MKEIICDTNVWYNFDENTEIGNAKLIPTFCNVFELTHTINKGASIQAIENLHKGGFLSNMYFINPFAYIMFLDIGKAPYLQSEALIKDLFLALAKGEITKEELENKTKPILKKNELQDIATVLNSPMIRGDVTFTNETESAIEWTKKYITFFVTQWAKNILGIEYYVNNNFDWTRIELFLNTLALFNRKIVFHKMRYNDKDMIDLWNMVYVKPENLYWTWEGINRETNEVKNQLRWHTLIREAGMKRYLFLPNR